MKNSRITLLLWMGLMFFNNVGQAQLTRPRLLIEPSDISAIQNKVTSGYCQSLFGGIKNVADVGISNLSVSGVLDPLEAHQGAAIAFYGVIAGSSTYKTAAKTFAQKFLIPDNQYTTDADYYLVYKARPLVYIFDLLYNDLSQSERQQYIEKIYHLMRQLNGEDPLVDGTSYVTQNAWDAYANRVMKYKPLVALLAIALQGEPIPSPSPNDPHVLSDGTFDATVATDLLEEAWTFAKIGADQNLLDGAGSGGAGYDGYVLEYVSSFREALVIFDRQTQRSSVRDLLEYHLGNNSNNPRVYERLGEFALGEMSISTNYMPCDGNTLSTHFGNGLGGVNTEFGADLWWYLPVTAEHFGHSSDIYAHHRFSNPSNLAKWGTSWGRGNHYLLALKYYNNVWGDATNVAVPSVPFSAKFLGCGSYYWKNSWDAEDAQFAVTWWPILSYYTGKFSLGHDWFNSGAFQISNGGNDWVCPPLSINYQESASVTEDRQAVMLIDGHGHKASPSPGGTRSGGKLRTLSEGTTSSVLDMDLSDPYNLYYSHITSDNGLGYGCTVTHVDNPVERADRDLLIAKGAASIPTYYIDVDVTKQDENQHDYGFQFYSDFERNGGPSLVTYDPNTASFLDNPWKMTLSDYSMQILNLSSHPLCISNSPYNGDGIQGSKTVIGDNNVVKTIMGLMFLPFKNGGHATPDQLPTITKKKAGDADWGKLAWSSGGVEDFFSISDRTWFHDFLNSNGNGQPGLESVMRLSWLRTNTADHSLAAYSLSRGITTHYKAQSTSPFSYPTNVNPFQIVGTFGHYNSSVTFDGVHVDLNTYSDDGSSDANSEFLLFAPNPASGNIDLKINGVGSQFSRPSTSNSMSKYISKFDPIWDFSCPAYGSTLDCHSLVADMNGDGYPDLLTFAEWGTLYIDYGPLYGAWDYTQTFGAQESHYLKFFVLPHVGYTPYPTIALVSNNHLKVGFQKWNGTFESWSYDNIPFPDNNDMTVCADVTGNGPFGFATMIPGGGIDLYHIQDHFQQAFQTIQYLWQPQTYPQAVYSGDFDGDGKTDLATYYWVTNTKDPHPGEPDYYGFFAIDYQANGFGSTDVTFPTNLDYQSVNYRNITVTDYDHDGMSDIGVIGQPTWLVGGMGNWYLYQAKSNFVNSGPTPWVVNAVDLSSDVTVQSRVLPADYNGNGQILPGMNSETGCFRISYQTPPAFKPSTPLNRTHSSSLRVSTQPNPFKDYVTIHVDASSPEVSLTVWDLLGRVVKQESSRVTEGSANFVMLSSGLENGSYYYRVTSGAEAETGALVLSH